MTGIRPFRSIPLLLAALAPATPSCSALHPEEPPPSPAWSFTLDGIPLDPPVLSLEDGPGPAAGDLLPVGEWLVPLDRAGRLDFATDLRGATALALREGDGTLRRIGIVLDEARLGVAVLAAMTDAEAREVRCLRIETWSEEAARQVTRLDGSRLAVVFSPVSRGTPLPALPADLRWLAVAERKEGAVGSMASLSCLRSLRFLRIRRWARGEDFDAGLLAGMQSLSRLDLAGLDVEDEDLLGTLGSLRALDLSRCGVPWNSGERTPLSVHFVRRLRNLRSLSLSGSTVTNLAPLGGHPSLEEVRADGLRPEALPAVALPALREIRLVGTAVGEDALAAFRAANPAARVVDSWKAVLVEATKGADRVLLRTGGTCHRHPGSEKVLLDSGDPGRIRWVLDTIVVADGASGGGCMCCGDPTIEFRRGGLLLAELGMHHGVALRWPGGWPGDGTLTLDSRDVLTAWMAECGSPGPQVEWRKDRARIRSGQARWDLLLARVPPPVGALLTRGTERDDLLAAIRRAMPDPVPLAVLCLRLYGTGEGTWIRPWGLDHLLEDTLLPGIAAKDMREAIGTAAADPVLADGAARWLLSANRLPELDAATTARILPVLGGRALAHPRAWNRRRTLEVLAGSPTEEAAALLRRFLDPGIPVRPLDEVLVEEPFEGFLPPAIGEVYAGFSDRAFAAVLLARRGDRESLPVIRAMRAEAPEADRAILDEAIDLLAR